jgi:pilus assembly protein CpaE
MAELSAVIIAADDEQRTILQLMVNATGLARVSQCFGAYAATATDGLFRRLEEAKPNVVLVDIDPNLVAPALHTIEMLRAQNRSLAVFAIGDMKQPPLIVSAMRAGAGEFLDRPVSSGQLLDAFTRHVAAQRRVTSKNGVRGKVFAFINAKGGSGATSVAVNTALALAAHTGRAALIDLAPIGHAALHLNVRPSFTVSDAFNNLNRLDAALLDGYMTRHISGVALLAGAPDAAMASQVGSAEMSRLFDLMVHEYRAVVVDLSTRVDLLARSVCELSDLSIVVAQPDMPSLWGASQIEQTLFSSAGRERLRLLVNRFHKNSFSERDIEAASRTTILWKVPNDWSAFSHAIERGNPVVRQNHSAVARSFGEFAQMLVDGKPADKPRRWLIGA